MKERTEYLTALLGVFFIVISIFVGIPEFSIGPLSSPVLFISTLFFSMGIDLLYTFHKKRWDWKMIFRIFISSMGVFWILFNVPVLLSVPG